MKYIIIALLTALLIGIVYSAIIYDIDKPETALVSWFNSLFATLISVLLGISVAMLLFQAQQKCISNKDRERFRSLLCLELTNIYKLLSLEKFTNLTLPNGKQTSLQILTLKSVITEHAGASGLFKDIDSFTMFSLSSSIKMWNRKTEGLMNAINSNPSYPGFISQIEWYKENLEESKKGIFEGISKLTKSLKIDLK